MIRRIAGAILVVIVFNATALGVMSVLAPPLGLAWVILLTLAFSAWTLRRGGRRERVVALRLRRPAAAPRIVLLSAASTLLVLLGIGSFVALIAPDMDAADIPQWYHMMEPYTTSAAGWAALILLIAFAIPMVEEFSFRGRIQRVLERRYGVATAITVTSVLFMVMHIGVPHWSILAVSLSLGVMCGIAVHVFRSIWPAVLFHCVWNGSLLATELVAGDPALPEPGPAAMAVSGVLLTGLGALGWRRVLTRRDARSEADDGTHPVRRSTPPIEVGGT
jgi:membrane protease YdiL (CAAX protease family)